MRLRIDLDAPMQTALRETSRVRSWQKRAERRGCCPWWSGKRVRSNIRLPGRSFAKTRSLRATAARPSALTPALCQPHKMHANSRTRLPSPAGSGEGLGMRAAPTGQPQSRQKPPKSPQKPPSLAPSVSQALQALSAQKHFFRGPFAPETAPPCRLRTHERAQRVSQRAQRVSQRAKRVRTG